MITLNTLEIITNKSDVDIYAKPYNGDWEALRQYREENPNLNFHSWRNFDTEEHLVYCWSLNDDYSNLPSGFIPKSINEQTHPNIWCRILDSGLIKLLEDNGKKLYKCRYSNVWEMSLNKDKSGFRGKGLYGKPVLRFSFHFPFSINSNRVNFFLALRKTYSPILTYKNGEYQGNGIDTREWERNVNGEIIPNRSNVKKLLLATGQNEKYLRFRNKVESLSTEYKYLLEFKDMFNSIISKIALPDGLAINEFLLSNLPNSHFSTLSVKKPQYYFYNESTGGGYYNERVQKLKPTTYDVFKEKHIKILVLTPQEYEGTVGRFSTRVVDTLRSTFHIKNVSQEVKTYNHNEENIYKKVLNNIDFSEFDIVLQVFSSKDKNIPVDSSPYYLFKAKLVNQRIPSQKVLIETIRQDSRQIIDAIALNVYTKLGGTAWTIEKDKKDRTEVIIGISSTVDFYKNRVMGFANVLDYRGKFLTGRCTQLSDIDSYSKNLEQHLVGIIETLIEEKNIAENDMFRLIFHLTKEAGKDSEIEAIESALARFKNYQIQFGIVHLSYNHNYRIFSNEGKNYTERGTFIRISQNQALLHLGKPTKTPVLVRRDVRSTFEDLYDMTKHVLHFSHLSHRSYRPSLKPVTIQYPNIMAKLVSDLKEVPDWDKSMIDKLNGKLWFI